MCNHKTNAMASMLSPGDITTGCWLWYTAYDIIIFFTILRGIFKDRLSMLFMLRVRVYVDEDTLSYGVTVLLQVHDTRYKNPQLSAKGFQHNSPHLDIQRQAGTSNVNILLTSFHRQNQPDRPVMHQ